jgi:hypothetical protein
MAADVAFGPLTVHLPDLHVRLARLAPQNVYPREATTMKDDDLDSAALLARRDLLARRALLAGVTGIAAGAASCAPRIPCLSPPAQPYCHGAPDAPVPAGTFWKKREYLGGVATDKGPLFGSDTAVDSTRAGTDGVFSFDANVSGINDLNPVGIAAFEELVPSLANAKVSIRISIYGDAPGPGVDANARALAIQTFLASKGVQAEAHGQGTCASGTFNMTLLVVACIAPPPPG